VFLPYGCYLLLYQLVFIGQDSDYIRQKILSISGSDWKKMGFSKGTLHYVKMNDEVDKPLI
jgi:hypothetical protein